MARCRVTMSSNPMCAINPSSVMNQLCVSPRGRSCARFSLALFDTATVAFAAIPARAQTWNVAAGGTWTNAANWNPASVPNAVGAAATFISSSPAQTASRSVTTDAAVTVGSITFNPDVASTTNNTTIATGTGGSITFDETAGSATLNFPTAVGSGRLIISAPMVLNDSVVATVDNVSAVSAAGACDLTGTMSGTGGFTKLGLGLGTFGTGAKTFTGACNINAGRMRISNAARPQNTSGLTVNTGGQIDLIAAGTYTFGTGPLTLNGAGPTSGPFSPFPGALRPDTGLVITINNDVVLASDAMIHMQGSASGVLTLAGIVSGPGKLTYTSMPHDANLGKLVLNGANTYSGGTLINGGTLVLSGASATLGSGDVTVVSANAAFGGASAKLSIQSGVLNAIADTATLSLAGGNAAGVADDGYADLGAGVNEVVGKLVLAGVTQPAGTYGSTASPAEHQSDEFFS